MNWNIVDGVASIVVALATGAVALGAMRSANAAREMVQATIRPFITLQKAG